MADSDVADGQLAALDALEPILMMLAAFVEAHIIFLERRLENLFGPNAHDAAIYVKEALFAFENAAGEPVFALEDFQRVLLLIGNERRDLGVGTSALDRN